MPNLRVINQENGGQSVARNTGIDAAHGEWLMFVDADDFLEPDALLQLATTAEENNLEIALCNARYHHEGRKPDHSIYAIPPETIIE